MGLPVQGHFLLRVCRRAVRLRAGGGMTGRDAGASGRAVQSFERALGVACPRPHVWTIRACATEERLAGVAATAAATFRVLERVELTRQNERGVLGGWILFAWDEASRAKALTFTSAGPLDPLLVSARRHNDDAGSNRRQYYECTSQGHGSGASAASASGPALSTGAARAPGIAAAVVGAGSVVEGDGLEAR